MSIVTAHTIEAPAVEPLTVDTNDPIAAAKAVAESMMVEAKQVAQIAFGDCPVKREAYYHALLDSLADICAIGTAHGHGIALLACVVTTRMAHESARANMPPAPGFH